jgi:hypothetical protein
MSARVGWLAIVLSVAALSSLRVAGAESSAYSLRITFSNQICTVRGTPGTINGFPFIGNSVALTTDGAGQVSGSGWLWVDYSNAPYSAFLVDVTGKISSTTAQPAPTVTLTIGGPGYTLDGQGNSTPNSIRLKFTGQAGPDSNNPSQTVILGRMTGSISGATPLGQKSAAINVDAVITDVSFTPLTLVAQVEQSSKQMLLFNADFNGNGNGNPIFDLTGTGQVNSSSRKYRFTAKGIGVQKGWNLTVNGDLGTLTSSSVPGVQFSAPVSAQVSGKVQGQQISGSTTDIQADLVPGN